MIYEKFQFEKVCGSDSVKLAALPQDNQKWCLAVKVGSATAYLGDSNVVIEFSTLDDVISYAHQNGIGKVLVITGARPWRF